MACHRFVAFPDCSVGDCFVLSSDIQPMLRGGLRHGLDSADSLFEARGGALSTNNRVCKRPAASVHDEGQEPRVRWQRITVYPGGAALPKFFAVKHGVCEKEVELLLYQHFAIHPACLTVSVRDHVYRCTRTHPLPCHPACSHWCERVRTLLGRKERVFLGMRATRARGLSRATSGNEDFVRELNRWLASWLPLSFSWNALGLLRHAAVQPHIDRFNTGISMAITLSPNRAHLGHYSALEHGPVMNLMTRSPVFFDPCNWHEVHADATVLTLVAYTTSRLPDEHNLNELRQLQFRPLLPHYIPHAQPESDSSSSEETESSSVSSSEVTHSSSAATPSSNGATTESPSGSSDHQLQLVPMAPSDSEDLVPLQRLATRGATHPAIISPTLPFTGPSLPYRDTHAVFDAAGQPLRQLHAAQLCPEASGIALVNWSSWQSVKEYTSKEVLLIFLPGHRTFELDAPPAAQITRTDIVIEDSVAQKRFPRMVTMVSLGAKPAVLSSDTTKPPPQSAAAPVELAFEIDSRAWEGTSHRQSLKVLVDDVLQKNGAHNRIYAAKTYEADRALVYSARMRTNLDEAKKLLEASGRNGIFIKPVQYCASLLPEFALVWLPSDRMESKPALYLRNLQQELGSTGGLCRSDRCFGIRVETRVAGKARAEMAVQKAHQFDWNEDIIPKIKCIVRGLPASYADVEVAEILHTALSWRQVPLRRLKTSSAGVAVWLVGALALPTSTHVRIGTHLVTIESAPEDTKAKTKPSKNWGAARSGRRVEHGAGALQSSSRSSKDSWSDPAWDPWKPARDGAQSSGWWKKQNAENHPPSAPWGNYVGAAAALTTSADTAKVDALEQRVARMENLQTTSASKMAQVETRLTGVEGDLQSLGNKMQSNFDRLFAAFESRNIADADQPRKLQRTDDLRGGTLGHVQPHSANRLQKGATTTASSSTPSTTPASGSTSDASASHSSSTSTSTTGSLSCRSTISASTLNCCTSASFPASTSRLTLRGAPLRGP
eukprot:5134448-Amphidinium_carterae.3